MPASPSSAVSSQFDATQCHPEFGYLAPATGFRRKVALTVKAATCGVLIGAAAMFVLGADRDEQAAIMLATPVVAPPPAAATRSTPARAPTANAFAAVRFVSETSALPAAAGRGRSGASSTVALELRSTIGPPLDLSAVAAAPASAPEAKAAAKPKKKIARDPQPDRVARSGPAEPEPQMAFAAPFRRIAEQARAIFGFGW